MNRFVSVKKKSLLKFSFIIWLTNNTGWASGIPGFDFLKITNDNAQSSTQGYLQDR